MDFKSQIATTRDQSKAETGNSRHGVSPHQQPGKIMGMGTSNKTSHIEREVLDTGKNSKTGKPFP